MFTSVVEKCLLTITDLIREAKNISKRFLRTL